MKLFYIKLIILVLWLLINLYFIFQVIMGEDDLYRGENLQLVYMKLLIATTPLGYVFGLIGELIGMVLNFQSVKVEIIITMFLMVLGGYIQWFIIVPLAWRKLVKMHNYRNDKRN